MADAGPDEPLRFGPMSPEDVAEVHEVERQSFASPWSLATFYSALAALDHFRTLVARSARGELLGYAAWFDLDEEVHVASLAVLPSWTRPDGGARPG
jgi:hypothetical protein